MTKLKVQTPFFIFNPKSHLYGDELLELAEEADNLAAENDISIFVTGPYSDLPKVAENTDNIIVTAQHIDGMDAGGGMGYALPVSLSNTGVRATFLNHAEHPITLSELNKAIAVADELDMLTIVCADSIVEAKAVAMLNPDVILCEPTELIGTGKTSDDSYIEKTNEAIREINPEILVMQAAGISTSEDVYRTISLGADGTGSTSGIVKADDPKQMLIDMVEAAVEAQN